MGKHSYALIKPLSMLTMIKLVVFDLDDTLYLEIDYVYSGFSAVANYLHSMTNIESDDILNFMKEAFRQDSSFVFDRTLRHFKLQHLDVQNLIAHYRHHQPKISIQTTTFQLLSELRQKVKLAIVSDGYLIVQKNKIASLDLSTLFDSIVLTDQWGQDFWKPHRKAFDYLMESFNLKSEEILYVGDNPSKDFIFGKTVGIYTVQLLSNGVYKNEDYLDGFTPSFQIHNLDELFLILDTINHNV